MGYSVPPPPPPYPLFVTPWRKKMIWWPARINGEWVWLQFRYTRFGRSRPNKWDLEMEYGTIFDLLQYDGRDIINLQGP